MTDRKHSRPPGEDPRDAWLVRILPQLRSYVRQNMSADLHVVEATSDVVQSACREVLAGAQRRRQDGWTESRFRASLFQAAWRKIIDRFRRHQAHKRRPPTDAGRADAGVGALRELVDGGPTPPSRVAREEHAVLLAQARARLSAEQQQAIRWFYDDGLSHAEIARRTGRSEAAAKMFVRRAVARLGIELKRARPSP